MDDVLWEAVARPRFLMFLLTSFAGIALVLAAVGIYGVMAHTVAQRTHEIGLRVALGARPAQVRAMVLRQAATLVAAGVGLGLAAAVVLSELLGGVAERHVLRRAARAAGPARGSRDRGHRDRAARDLDPGAPGDPGPAHGRLEERMTERRRPTLQCPEMGSHIPAPNSPPATRHVISRR